MARTTKYWIFTWNNPDVEGEELRGRLEQHVEYAVFQLEAGEEETPHFQGYCVLTRSRGLAYVRKIIACHWEHRRGTHDQARDYCMKEETRRAGPWEVGSYRKRTRGKRNDLIAFRDAIRQGKRRKVLVEEFPKMMSRYPRFVATVRGTMAQELRLDLVVRLNYGRTGTGKSRYAYEAFEELYSLPVTASSLWFDNYDGEEVVLIDDFAGRASKVTLAYLLRLLDIYPLQVPVKGSYVWWNPKIIVITTNIYPREWYKYEGREEQYWALARRITHVFEYSEEREPEFRRGEEFF